MTRREWVAGWARATTQYMAYRTVADRAMATYERGLISVSDFRKMWAIG